MTINAPEKQDLSALRSLWKEAFKDSDAFLDIFFEKGFSFDRCRLLKKGGNVAAALYWFDCQWENKKVAYLYAIATKKAFQGQGLCRKLMADTHKHLKNLGYAGAALVPANEGLFSLYQKLGYESFCPMDTMVLQPEENQITLSPIDATTYGTLRRKLLPAGAILQEGATLAFLEGFAQFYQLDSGIACAVKEAGTLYIQEYLADPKQIPALTFALKAEKAHLRLWGKTNCAMYLPLDGSQKLPCYLGLHLN